MAQSCLFLIQLFERIVCTCVIVVILLLKHVALLENN